MTSSTSPQNADGSQPSLAVLDGWLQSMHILPLGAYDCRVDAGWSVSPRTKEETILFVVSRGRMEALLDHDNDRYTIDSGHVLLVPQGTPHVLFEAGDAPLRFSTVHFHATVLGIDLCTLLAFPKSFPISSDAPFQAASAASAQEYAGKKPGYRRIMEAELTRLLCYVARFHSTILSPRSDRSLSFSLPRLIPALRLIDRRIADPSLGVKEIADALFVSEVHLRKLFKRVTGHGPVEFVQKRRIALASSMLRMNHAPIKQIAERCGFSDLPFFYRVFRKWTATTPGEYRKDAIADYGT